MGDVQEVDQQINPTITTIVDTEEGAEHVREKILSTINKITRDPADMSQNEDILSDEREFNDYLLKSILSSNQLFKPLETYEYIRDNIDEFRGTGVWPEGGSLPLVWSFFYYVATSDGNVAEIIPILEEVFSLDSDQIRNIVIRAYLDFCVSSPNDWSKDNYKVFETLRKQLPLDETDRNAVVKNWLSERIDSSARQYYEGCNGKSHSVDGLNLSSFGLVQKNMSTEPNPGLFDDPEIVRKGQDLIKAMLLYTKENPGVMEKIIQLHQLYPSFFGGDFDSEIKTAWNNIMAYGSFTDSEQKGNDKYCEQTFELLKIFEYDTEKTKILIKDALVTRLSSAKVLGGLIERYVKNTEYAELLSDEEVIQSARLGREKALSHFFDKGGTIWNPPDSFRKISEIFNLSDDWASDPEEVTLVKGSALGKIEEYYTIDLVNDIANLDRNSILINDAEIRAAIEKAILDDSHPYPWARVWGKWKATKDIFETWGLSSDRLREYAKKFVISKISEKPLDEIYYLFSSDDCQSAFPEVFESSEIQKLVTDKIAEFKFEGASYGDHELSEMIKAINREIKRFNLNPELFEKWKSSAAVGLLSDVKDQEQLKSFQETFHSFKLTPQDMKILAIDSSLVSLSKGEIANALFLEKQFAIKFSETDSEKLSQAGEAGMLIALQQKDLHSVVTIQGICNLSQSFFNQPEVSSNLGQLVSNCSKKEDFSILPDVLVKVPEVRQELIKSFASRLLENDRGTALIINNKLDNDPEVTETIISAVSRLYREMGKKRNDLSILQLPEELRKYISKVDLENSFIIETEGEHVDPQIKTQFAFLRNKLGQNKFTRIFISGEKFWGDVHNNLLFVGRLLDLPSDKTDETAALVLPLVTAETDFILLFELLGYFDVGVYKEKNMGELTHFENFEQFTREAYLQRYDIKVPEGSSDGFRQAIEHLIEVRGVDINFLRILCQQYSVTVLGKDRDSEVDISMSGSDDDDDGDGWSSYNNGSYEFADKIIDILEKKDLIDERKLIKPFKTTISLDPLEKIVFNAIGFYSLNNLTPKMAEFLNDPNGLGAILKLFEMRDDQTKENIIEQRDKLIAALPAKRNRYIAEADKKIQGESLIKLGSGNRPERVNINDADELQFLLGEEQIELAKEALQNSIYNSESFRDIVNVALTELAKRAHTLDNVFDLAHFEELARVGETLTAKEQKPDASELVELLSGKEALFSVFLLWLSLNNQKRSSQSATIKKQIDSILNQQRYRQQNDSLKQKGLVAPNSNATLSYLQGQLNIEQDDSDAIRQVLLQFGYQDIGRTLDVEIAAGSDVTAWTCGDETNCCMPFTATKNQEYLLRDDTAYFVVKLNDRIIAQSVLVEAQDEEDGHRVVAIDNIEIANNAIKYRSAIAEAYKHLRLELAKRYADGDRFQIVIGTSYNDDGGTITGDCEIEPITAKPIKGEMEYSDWAHHSSNYLFYDSETSQAVGEKYFGLQIDMFDRSQCRALIIDEREKTEVLSFLHKIGQGEDDGDGGLTFPDNYSCTVVEKDRPVGYIIAADYISDDTEFDLVHIEKIKFSDNVDSDNVANYLRNYLERKKFVLNKDLDGILISNTVLKETPNLAKIIQETVGFPNQTQIEDGIRIMR